MCIKLCIICNTIVFKYGILFFCIIPYVGIVHILYGIKSCIKIYANLKLHTYNLNLITQPLSISHLKIESY